MKEKENKDGEIKMESEVRSAYKIHSVNFNTQA